MPKDSAKTAMVGATAEMVDMSAMGQHGLRNRNAELDEAIKHMAVLTAGKGFEAEGEIEELLQGALAKCEDERYKTKRIVNTIAAAAANGDQGLALCLALQPLPFPSYTQLETNVQADTPTDKRLTAVQTGIALLKHAAEISEEGSAAHQDSGHAGESRRVAPEYGARTHDYWRLVHVGASILHALVRRRQKRIINLLALGSKDGIISLFNEVLVTGVLDVLCAACWRKPAEPEEGVEQDEEDGAVAARAAQELVGPNPAQMAVHQLVRELARNSQIRDKLKTRPWHDVGFLLAILRCPVNNFFAEREKMGVANTEMVPQHWAIGQLRKRLGDAEADGSDEVHFRTPVLREIYDVLRDNLRHRELHLESVDVIGAHCVKQLNLGLEETLQLVKQMWDA